MTFLRKLTAHRIVRAALMSVLVAAWSRELMAQSSNSVPDATTLHGKVMCGYQGWFRCPGDSSKWGWMHWSRSPRTIAPGTLTFELWPDMSAYPSPERYPAPGFTYPDGRQAELFSSDNAATVQRHFEWMRDYGLDGVWLQRFAVDLPGGPMEQAYKTFKSVLGHVREAARKTGRTWAVCYDVTGMPAPEIYDAITKDWEKLLSEGVTSDANYLHQDGRPVVQIWGFYRPDAHHRMTAELGNKLIDFFAASGTHPAFLVGGGDWNWRENPDPEWQALFRRLPAYCPWNVGNYSSDAAGVSHANTSYWAKDKQECAGRGELWIPVIYPGFSWDNLTRKPPGTSTVARRGGQFFWEQFHALAALGKVDSVYIAMFDEVDEGTAIFKVTSDPPVQARFVGFDHLPSDWYLRLAGAGADLLRREQPIPPEIPVRP